MWRTWDCVNHCPSAYTGRYAGWAGSAQQANEQHTRLHEAAKALGGSCVEKR